MTLSVGVSLLGPVLVHTAAGWAPVAGVKLQALVAMLALSAPRPVSDDRLIDELWGDDQPAKPANALQAQVSQLRRVLGPDAVVRQGSGYALAVEAAAVDTLQLEDLVRDGRTAAGNGEHRAAAARFEAAVALIRGPPLGDLLDHRFAREAASRLDQIVVSAHEGFVDAELASGHHAAVVGRLTDLVDVHPLHERFHAQLMVALFRSGRQSDALRAYQQVRALLADELGLEPGPELRALERAVLSQDPSLAAPIPLASMGQLARLPLPLSTFVGRSTELDVLRQAMATARLVTLVGAGGAGKTRLVLEVAGRLAAEGEVWFVDLAPIADPGAVAEAVASAMGARDHSPTGSAGAPAPPELRAIARLGDRTVVLVLDNCEHVLDTAAAIAARLLSACRGLRVVATSREPLGVPGEHQCALGPMTDDDATALFAARAEAVQPRFRAGRDEASLVALCRHLDGLPLAIELAAARAKTLPVPEIAARLRDRFELLVTPKRAATGRQDGLRATIDWSYDLLFDDEKRAFRHLAVFAGGATVDAAQEVCGPDALDIVARLVDKSLLVAETDGPAARFRMLESLRAYGVDRLVEAGELAAATRAHGTWCTALAEDAEAGIRGPDQLAWLDRLDAEHDNIRAALASAADADPATGLRIIGALVFAWWFRGRGREARHWMDLLLAAASDPPPRVLAKTLTWSGLLADFGDGIERPGGFEHELDLADQRQRDAVALGLEAGDELIVAYARSQHALTLTRRALAGLAVDRDELAALVEAAATAFERLDDQFGAGTTRTIEAVGLLAAGDLDRCGTAIRSARDHALRCGDRYVQGRAEWIAGLLADAAGDAPGPTGASSGVSCCSTSSAWAARSPARPACSSPWRSAPANPTSPRSGARSWPPGRVDWPATTCSSPHPHGTPRGCMPAGPATSTGPSPRTSTPSPATNRPGPRAPSPSPSPASGSSPPSGAIRQERSCTTPRRSRPRRSPPHRVRWPWPWKGWRPAAAMTGPSWPWSCSGRRNGCGAPRPIPAQRPTERTSPPWPTGCGDCSVRTRSPPRTNGAPAWVRPRPWPRLGRRLRRRRRPGRSRQARLSAAPHREEVPSDDRTWNAPPLSTTSAEAASRYRRGIAALVAGIDHAEDLLAEAVAIDPDFHLARIGIAVARAAAGESYVAPTPPPGPTRRLLRGERQHGEIVAAALTGDRRHAADLRREHLLEYPGDLLVVWLPAFRPPR